MTSKKISFDELLMNSNLPFKQAYEQALESKVRSGHIEDIIKNHSGYSFLYAKNIIKGRFIEAEELILQSPFFCKQYLLTLANNDLLDILNLPNDEVLILKLKYSEKELKGFLCSKISQIHQNA